MDNSMKDKIYRENTAKRQNLNLSEYRKRCRNNIAKKRNLTSAEYSRKCVEKIAAKKGITVSEYAKIRNESMAKKQGFPNFNFYNCYKAYCRKTEHPMTKEEFIEKKIKDTEDLKIAKSLGFKSLKSYHKSLQ